MKTPIDRVDMPLSAYLLKIITALVKASNNEIRIAATDMLDDNAGDGITKWYDKDKKQLVLSYLQPGSEVLFIKPEESVNQCPPNVISQPRSSQVQPLPLSTRMDSSLSSQWDNQPQQPSPLPMPSIQSRHPLNLDDERLAELEDYRRKQRASEVLANFPGTPIITPRSQPLPQRPLAQSRNQVRPQYYRD